MRDLIVLDDGLLLSMLSNQQFISQISCVAAAATAAQRASADCHTCSGVKAQQAASRLDSLKHCLLTLSGDQKNTLRRLLDARQLRLSRRVGKKLVQYTF